MLRTAIYSRRALLQHRSAAFSVVDFKYLTVSRACSDVDSFLHRLHLRRLSSSFYEQNRQRKSEDTRWPWLALGAFSLAVTPLGVVVLLEEQHPSNEEFVLEALTGVPFPKEIKSPNGSSQVLVGCGARLMTPLKVKVYTIGLYVAPEDTSSVLSQWRKDSEQSTVPFSDDPKFSNAVSQYNSFDRTIRLVMCREVEGGHLAKGFDRSMLWRIKKVANDLPGGKEGLKKVNSFFRGKVIPEKTVVTFSSTKEGKLIVTIGNKEFPPVNSPALCWAFYDMYFGEKTVAPVAKKAVYEGYERMLA